MQTIALWCTVIVLVGAPLALVGATIAIIIMTGRDHKLAMRRHCLNLARVHMTRGNPERAREYMKESEKYRLAGPRKEYL
jgi:hypothetical protein